MLPAFHFPRRQLPPWRRRIRRTACDALILVLLYLLLAYGVLPVLWRHYEHHPAMEAAPKTTFTKEGIPGDPLNIGVVGTPDEVGRAMLAAGWVPADATTLQSSLRISVSVLLNEPYPQAPISNLYVWGRPQDLSFQLPVGHSARQRHHVRFWKCPPDMDIDGRPLWIGNVTFDTRAGLSHYTGKVTHHIDANVDADRDKLAADLEATGQVLSTYQVTGVGATLQGRNGGGDWYYTDGDLSIVVVAPANVPQAAPPVALASPVAVRAKRTVFGWIRAALSRR